MPIFIFLRFAFGGKAYQYKVLPFGLALAPRTFTKCMDAALALLRLQGIRALNYHSRELVSRRRDVVLRHIRALGLRMNTKKSVLSPSQQTVFLGVHLDSVQMQARLASCPDFQPQYMFGPLQARPSCLREHLSQALRPHGRSLPCAAVPLVDETFRGPLHRTCHSPSKGVAHLLSHPFNMAGPPFSPEWSQNGRNSPSPKGHDGRIPDRLGRSL